MTRSEIPTDLGVIDAITLPRDGMLPDLGGSSGQEEYDSYFRLERGTPDATSWVRTCLQVQRAVMRDLDRTELSAEDRNEILAGCLTVLHSTLERWINTDEDADR
ncbi:hypothetical protein [Aeromicrobium sp. CF3.5]|uniref:hypothetical protein n=1 Tax=Aeromicrobium sp. CF3.5 TaxID=3373078 RepID=UPI003EE6DECC